MTREELLKWIDGQADNAIGIWRELVCRESPSSDKNAVDELGSQMESYLQGMGMSTYKHWFPEAGMGITAWTEERSLPPILLMGHIDTVHPKGAFGDSAFRVDEDGNVHGPGVYDMKGGVAAAMLAIRALNRFGYQKRQLRLALIGDEEVAHEYSELKSIEIFKKEAGAAAAFNMESGALNGDVVTGRKGALVARIRVKGVAAHSGREPWNGASAVREAARKVLKIEALTDYNGTTYNCGQIEGGIGANTVPDTCTITMGIRFNDNSGYYEVMRNLKEITEDNEDPRVTAELIEVAGFNAMEKTPKTDALFELYQNACSEMGLRRPEQMFTGGCSDASYTTMLGIPTLCGVGVRGAFNHTTKEYAVLSSITEQAKKLVLTILDMPDDF